jgi:integrase
VVPLSPAALAVLAELPKAGEFIFTTDGVRPISDFGHFKQKFDRVAPLPNWNLHDLRRTARSLMSRAKVPADIGERCLAHVIGGVQGTYDRWSYLDQKRDAFEKLAGLVERIVNPQSNVVTLRG